MIRDSRENEEIGYEKVDIFLFVLLVAFMTKIPINHRLEWHADGLEKQIKERPQSVPF